MMVHVTGNSNVLTDALSRDHPTVTEWALDTVFSGFCLGVRVHVELFATKENYKLPLYLSPILDGGVNRDSRPSDRLKLLEDDLPFSIAKDVNSRFFSNWSVSED